MIKEDGDSGRIIRTRLCQHGCILCVSLLVYPLPPCIVGGPTSPLYWRPPMQSIQVASNDANLTGSVYISRGHIIVGMCVQLNMYVVCVFL